MLIKKRPQHFVALALDYSNNAKLITTPESCNSVGLNHCITCGQEGKLIAASQSLKHYVKIVGQ